MHEVRIPGSSPRRRLVGAVAIAEALARGAEIRLVVCERGELTDAENDVVARARARGIAVRAAGDRERLRLTDAPTPARLLAVEGPSVDPMLDELMARDGLILALVGLRYPGNVGFVVRAAEVAGAEGVVLCEDWTRAERASAMRFAMQANRYFPVIDARAEQAVDAARRAGRALYALETDGRRTPWEAPLASRPVVFLGGEAEGIPRPILERMDEILRIPMRGFIPSYNVQAATAILLGEWLRQTTR